MNNNRLYMAKVKPLQLTPDRGAMVAHIECFQCGAHDRWRLTVLPEPDIIRRHFSIRGWSIKRKAICPQCKSKKDAKPMNNVAKIEPKTAPQLPSPDARAQRREAHGLIELSFDIGKGCYQEGYSDARIASETGASLAWVKQRREEEFGPLKQPDEIAQLRAEIETIAADFTARVEAVGGKLTALIAKNGWAA